MGSHEKYLQPKVIQQIKRLDLKARYIVDGFISGLHESPYHGFSCEFSEYRKYNRGDDINRIDWVVFAKTEKLYIRKYQAETNMECMLAMDVSESMGWTHKQTMTKLEYAACLAGSLSYMLIHQQDPVGLTTFNEKILRVIPARTKKSHLFTIFGELDSRPPFGQSNIGTCLHNIAEMQKHRGLVVILSDLLADPEPIIDAIHHLRFNGHDVLIFHILDEAEATFPYEDPAHFLGVEENIKLEVDPRGIRQAYLEAVAKFRDHYTEECRKSHVDFVPINTGTNFHIPLIEYLKRRKQFF